jgi:hypothetical protein
LHPKDRLSRYAAILMNHAYAIAKIGRYLHPVLINFHVQAILHDDLRSPEPFVVLLAIIGSKIVAYGRIIRDFMLYAVIRIREHLITFVKDVDIVDIRPQPGTFIVVYAIVANDEGPGSAELGAPGLPGLSEAGVVVECDLRILDRGALASPAHSQLPVVAERASFDMRPVADVKRDAVIPARRDVGQQPATRIPEVDGATLRLLCVFLHREISQHDI